MTVNTCEGSCRPEAPLSCPQRGPAVVVTADNHYQRKKITRPPYKISQLRYFAPLSAATVSVIQCQPVCQCQQEPCRCCHHPWPCRVPNTCTCTPVLSQCPLPRRPEHGPGRRLLPGGGQAVSAEWAAALPVPAWCSLSCWHGLAVALGDGCVAGQHGCAEHVGVVSSP